MSLRSLNSAQISSLHFSASAVTLAVWDCLNDAVNEIQLLTLCFFAFTRHQHLHHRCCRHLPLQ